LGDKLQSLQDKKIRFGIIPVVLLGFLLGYIVWYSAFEYPHHRHELDFLGSQWISTGDPSPNGYFVKEIFISEEVADAWISIAASDSVELFVNEKSVSQDMFQGLNVSSLHDITGKLSPGKNVIAGYVSRRSFPGEPRLLLKGIYTDLSGREHVLASDSSWRVSLLGERQGQGDLLWYSKDFDRSGWPEARTLGEPSTFALYQSEVAPYILGKALSGHWIWHPSPGVRTAYFTKSFTLDSLPIDALIGVAGISSFDMTVNGEPVVRGYAFKKHLQIYNIRSLLHPGDNTIGIGVKTMDIPPALFVYGVVRELDSVITIASDATWRVVSDISSEQSLPGSQCSEWKAPVLLAKYPYKPFGILSKSTNPVELPLVFIVYRFLRLGLFITCVVSIIVLLWISISKVHSTISQSPYCDSLFSDAVLHIPPLVYLSFIYMLQFDVRLDPSFPFNMKYVWVALGLLFVFRMVEFASLPFSSLRDAHASWGKWERASKYWCWGALVCLVAIGMVIRLHQLDFVSLNHDEISMMEYTRGLLERGYPSRLNGPYLKPMTTYELVPFSILLPVIMGGFNDYAARLHAVFWGTSQILLLYVLGRTLFNRTTGLLAAAIQCFHPWITDWSQNIFYPQLAQFLSSLTILFLYKAFQSEIPKKKFLYLTAISLSLTYISWEGTGFLLLALPLAVLALRAPDLSWVRNKHVWASFGMVCLAVIIQQSRRLLYLDAYLLINGKLADLSLPQLYFLEPEFKPYFYTSFFFFPENNWILSFFVILGLFLLMKYKPLRFISIILLVPIACLTMLLPIYAYRYGFYLESLLVLSASSVVVIFINHFKINTKRMSFTARVATQLSFIVIILGLFCSTNTSALKLYLLSKDPFFPAPQYREDLYETDYKSTSKFVESNLRDGDMIITLRSYPLEYYTGIIPDYSVTTLSRLTMFFDISKGGYPGLIEKYVGRPVISSLEQLKEITGRHDRVWLISAPDRLADENTAETVEFVEKNFRVVYETYNSKVYLWRKTL
jgi:hypothetical protein